MSYKIHRADFQPSRLTKPVFITLKYFIKFNDQQLHAPFLLSDVFITLKYLIKFTQSKRDKDVRDCAGVFITLKYLIKFTPKKNETMMHYTSFHHFKVSYKVHHISLNMGQRTDLGFHHFKVSYKVHPCCQDFRYRNKPMFSSL